MATGDIQVIVTQITAVNGTDFDVDAVISASNFLTTNTDVNIQAVVRSINGNSIIYDIIAQGRLA